MEPLQLTSVLTRWWWLLIVGALIGGAFAFGLSSREEPSYSATARLLVVQQPAPGTVVQLNDLQTSERLAATFVRLVTLRPILETARDEVGLSGSTDRLRGMLTVNNPQQTNLLEITARANDPVLASEVANAVADAFINSEEAAISSVAGELRVVESAIPPRNSEPQQFATRATAGVVLGFVLMLGVVFLLERSDDRIRGEADVRSVLGVEPIGRVSRFRARRDEHELEIVRDPASRSSEDLRALRTALLARLARRHDQGAIVQVSSAEVTDGKTTISTNLAAAIGLTGRRVVCIDADLRDPSAHDLLGTENTTGLTSYLLGSSEAMSVVLPTAYGNVSLVPSGPAVSNPSELLGSDRMHELLAALRPAFDVILIDTPPIGRVADGIVSAASADGVLVVVRQGHTRREAMRSAVADLAEAGVDLLGIVLNDSRSGSFARFRGLGSDAYGEPTARDRRIEDPAAIIR